MLEFLPGDFELETNKSNADNQCQETVTMIDDGDNLGAPRDLPTGTQRYKENDFDDDESEFVVEINKLNATTGMADGSFGNYSRLTTMIGMPLAIDRRGHGGDRTGGRGDGRTGGCG